MPSHRPKTCRNCERHESEVGRISWRGLCSECGRERYMANHDQMLVHSGPFADHWRRRTLAAFGVVDLDAGRDEA